MGGVCVKAESGSLIEETSKDSRKRSITKDKDNNFRCIVDCFVYDVQNYHTVKMVFDFVSFAPTSVAFVSMKFALNLFL